MSLSNDEVRHIARLARLDLAPAEVQPVASATGRSAPIAAAIGSSIRNT